MKKCYVVAWICDDGTIIDPIGYKTRTAALARIAVELDDYEGTDEEKMDAYNEDHSEDTEGGVEIHEIKLEDK
jgi:hypothetical protein